MDEVTPEMLEEAARKLKALAKHSPDCPISYERPIQDQSRCECGLWEAVQALEGR